MEKIKKFLREEDGMELSEYAVVGGILLVGAVGIITIWGTNIVTTFTAISGAISPAP
jgi:pilus assembly protein Flp/PilA